RAPLVDRLTSWDQAHVAVLAPAGYGKSTTVRLWEEADPRPFVWLQLDHLDDDPTHLMAHLASALAAQLAIDPGPVDALWGAPRSVDLDLLPAIGRSVTGADPMVVVLDDVQLIHSAGAQRGLEGLAAYLPPGSAVSLVGRTLPVG